MALFKKIEKVIKAKIKVQKKWLNIKASIPYFLPLIGEIIKGVVLFNTCWVKCCT